MLLESKEFAVLVDDGYQDLEVWYPTLRLREEGARVTLVGAGKQEQYKGKYGYPCTVDTDAGSVVTYPFDGVVIPGGWAPDRIRMSAPALEMVRRASDAGRLVASICHGGWVLISAGVLQGRTATSYAAIRDDMVNAGCNWVDEEVVRDGNLITSRTPDDLPAFLREIIGFFA